MYLRTALKDLRARRQFLKCCGGGRGWGFSLAPRPLIALLASVDMGVLAANVGYFSLGFVAKLPPFKVPVTAYVSILNDFFFAPFCLR